jgi:Family of unknown function (DUF5706)
MEHSRSSMESPQKSKKKKDKSRSIETMFKTTLSNHVQLSNMADQKAGLMISVNSIIISIMASFAVQGLSSNPKLIIPTSLLIAVCLLTITFAIIATKPSVKAKKRIAPENIDLLFFGHYTKLSLEEYKEAMDKLINDKKALRDQMTANIYAQGMVLNRKFRLLKIAYTIFMVGFPLVVICYFMTLSGLL